MVRTFLSYIDNESIYQIVCEIATSSVFVMLHVCFYVKTFEVARRNQRKKGSSG